MTICRTFQSPGTAGAHQGGVASDNCAAGGWTPGTGRTVIFEGWSLDTMKRELTDPDGVVVDLSTGEYDLLVTFLDAPQRVLSREYVLDATRNRALDAFDRSIDVQVSRLRRKIETRGEVIKTVRGAGYLFALPVRRA